MNHGRIEQVETPGRIYERPNTRFVADFLGTSNFIAATVEAVGATGALRTQSGLRLEAALPPERRIGDRLNLSLRPERIRLLPAEATGALVRGTIVEASFFGNMQRYLVRIDAGETLIATRPSLGEPMVPAGSAVGLAWEPRDTWTIPEPLA
jgi:ABC-type Fe3+/spermidine/putrescine transport system ATPase subunit